MNLYVLVRILEKKTTHRKRSTKSDGGKTYPYCKRRQHTELQFQVWRPLLQENKQIAKNDSNRDMSITQFVASTMADIFTPK